MLQNWQICLQHKHCIDNLSKDLSCSCICWNISLVLFSPYLWVRPALKKPKFVLISLHCFLLCPKPNWQQQPRRSGHYYCTFFPWLSLFLLLSDSDTDMHFCKMPFVECWCCRVLGKFFRVYAILCNSQHCGFGKDDQNSKTWIKISFRALPLAPPENLGNVLTRYTP